MDKMRMETPDLTARNVERIGAGTFQSNQFRSVVYDVVDSYESLLRLVTT